MTTAHCHGISPTGKPCQATRLCDAHIVPRGFTRDMLRGFKQVKKLSSQAVSASQHGVYDSHILCAKCDHLLGVYDKYAVEVCRRAATAQRVLTPASDLSLPPLVSIPDVDGDRLALFVLAVIWRAAISKRPEFQKVDLGDLGEPIAQVLFGHKPLIDLIGFQTYLERFQTKRPISPRGFYTSPYRVLRPERNAWAFALAGFRFTAKFDARSFDDAVKPFIINGARSLLCPIVTIEGGPEDAAFEAMVRAHHQRRMRRPAAVLTQN